MCSIYRKEIGYTGRDRWIWKNRWFRKPIQTQQIEVRTIVTEISTLGLSETVTSWRDIQPEDVGLWKVSNGR